MERSQEGTPEALVAAELQEETGLTADQLLDLGRLNPAYGFCNHAFDAYLATGLTAGSTRLKASEQDMVQRWFSEADFVDMVRSNEIVDAASVAAYLLLLMHRGAVTGRDR